MATAPRSGRRQRRTTAALVLGLVALLATLLAPIAATAGAVAESPTASWPSGRVLVTSVDGSDPSADIVAAGGTVEQAMPSVGMAVADLDASAAAALARSVRIRSVAPDRSVRLASADHAPEAPTSMRHVADVVDAPAAWRTGATGAGVDVALIDSGVAPVGPLQGRVVDGPDLSFDSQATSSPDMTEEQRRRLLRDGFGHGTHMAGIIAGAPTGDGFTGIAPKSRLVNIKVADAQGAADVSQIIAAIDWTVTNRRNGDLNIRVLNLSFGTESRQKYQFDPLAHAAEAAWRHGIVVVTSAGNTGRVGLTNPAYDPWLLAVAAADTAGTVTTADDSVPSFSTRGDGQRNPDLAAPGVSVASLRAPGSSIDAAHPAARVGTDLFRGTGTSQSAAVVSGAAAALLSARPDLKPDQVKMALMLGAEAIPAAQAVDAGSGLVDLRRALDADPRVVEREGRRGQAHDASNGNGSLEASRGGVHLVDAASGRRLEGEIDIFGRSFDSVRWSNAAATGSAWTGGTWNGVRWSGDCWTGADWASVRWASVRWASTSWAGADWASVRWAGVRWSSVRWNGEGWDSVRWAGVRWSSVRWQ